MNEKFIQPDDGITIVSHAAERGTILTDEAVEAGRTRVANGEDIHKVALDLVIQDLSLRGVDTADAIRTAKAFDGDFAAQLAVLEAAVEGHDLPMIYHLLGIEE